MPKKKAPTGHRKMTGLLKKLAKVPKSEIKEPKPTKRKPRKKK